LIIVQGSSIASVSITLAGYAIDLIPILALSHTITHSFLLPVSISFQSIIHLIFFQSCLRFAIIKPAQKFTLFHTIESHKYVRCPAFVLFQILEFLISTAFPI